jgi:hypothetical protein
VRAAFLDDVSATEAGRCARTRRRAKAGRRTSVISHEMSRHYSLEHPVDDPDEDDDDDDFDEDDDGDEDEDADEGDVETWQVSDPARSAKVRSLLDFGD